MFAHKLFPLFFAAVALVRGQPNKCSSADLPLIPPFETDWEPSGRQADCPPGTSMVGQHTEFPSNRHRLTCSGRGPPSFLTGVNSAWIPAFEGGGADSFYANCPAGEVITSRCGAVWGGSLCSLDGGTYKNGIQCRPLGSQFLLYPTAEWGCSGTCPEGTLAVSSCSCATQFPYCLSACDLNGCSSSNTFNAVRCQPWMFVKDLTWDFETGRESESLRILRDMNPIVGFTANIEVDFSSKVRASAELSQEYRAQFDTIADAQAKIVSSFLFPKYRFLRSNKPGSLDFVGTFDFDFQASFNQTFQAVAKAEVTTEAEGRVEVFSYLSNPLDDWTENFVRFVSYELTRSKEVIGTVSCCNCEQQVTNITMTYSVTQNGMLAVHIKDYPDLNLDTIRAEEVVELYLSGVIVGSNSPSPTRRFIQAKTSFLSTIFNFFFNLLFFWK